MPGLHHGNLCWGNRKSFCIHGEYPSEAMEIRRNENNIQPSSTYIPSNGYYGYHKVVASSEITEESMDTIEDNVSATETDVMVPLSNAVICRKRQNNETNLEHVKRLRCQERSESSDTFLHRDGLTSSLHTFNLGYCML